jgi:hypothetical protein
VEQYSIRISCFVRLHEVWISTVTAVSKHNFITTTSQDFELESCLRVNEYMIAPQNKGPLDHLVCLEIGRMIEIKLPQHARIRDSDVEPMRFV